MHGERAAITGRDEAGRQRAAAEGAAKEAQRQADDAGQRADELAKLELDAWRKADAAKASGDTALAAEATESAQGLAVLKINARLEEQAARDALGKHRALAARHADEEQRLDAEVLGAKRHAKQLEDVFDAQEDQAKEYRRAAAELTEAERLEAALPDLEARGVPGVDRIRTAAAEHRRLAAEAAERGNAYDKPVATVPDPPVSTTDPAPSPEPNRPVTLPPPVHDDLRDFSDDVGSPATSAMDGEPTELAAACDARRRAANARSSRRRRGGDGGDRDAGDRRLGSERLRRTAARPRRRLGESDSATTPPGRRRAQLGPDRG